MSSNTTASPGVTGDHAQISNPRVNRALRVAAVIDTRIVSGPGRQLASLAVALKAEGVEVLIITYERRGATPSPFGAHLDECGVRHVVIPERGPIDPRAVRRLAGHLAEFQADIVQTHSYKATAHAWVLRRLGAQRKWIGFMHGTTTEDRKAVWYHRLDRLLLGKADQVVIVSAAQLERFRSVRPRPRVIDNAVIPMAVQDPDSDTYLDLPRTSVPRLGVVGRLSSEKGVDIFLEACAALAGGGLDFTAVIAGDGPDRQDLEARCTALGLRQRVRFLGQVKDLPAVYRALDLLVIPSRSEGLPNVLLEALAADLPIAATGVGAIPYVVDDPLIGTLTNAGSPSLLADAIAASLRLRTAPGAADARARVVDRFSLARRVREHIDLYERVLGPSRT